MQQFSVPADMKVNIDYSDPSLPNSVSFFKPLVVQDGKGYCVILGPDPQLGVFGCGDTPKEALLDWERNLKERVKHPEKDDEVVKYIIESLQRSDNRLE